MGKRHFGGFLRSYPARLLRMSPMKMRFLKKDRKSDKTGSFSYERKSNLISPGGTVRRRRTFRSFVQLVKSFLRKMTRDKLDVYSAQSAFYLIMAFIPMLMLMLMFMKYLPLTEEMVLDTLKEVLNDSIMIPVQRIVGNVYHGNVAVLSIATFMMLWVSSKAILGLSNGLNSIHSIRENRNMIILRFRAMGYTILIIFSFVITLALLVGGIRFRFYLSTLFPFLRIHSRVMRVVFILVGLVFITLIFNMLYVFLPNRKKRFGSQLYGAVFTTIAWTIYTLAYSLYLTVAKNLSIIYGGLVTLMVTMLWLYFGLYFFFFGAEINAWIENPDSFPF